MAIPADGSYGIEPGVIYSYPVTCKGGRYEIVQGLSISDFSRGLMDATDKELREERAAVEELRAYFAGDLEVFRSLRAASGTAFQHQVWDAVAAVPFGRTRTYGEIASTIGRPTASRAVGGANGRNPLPVIIPCHPVLGSGGTLVGFGGGLERKRWLLEHERSQYGISLFSPTSIGRSP